MTKRRLILLALVALVGSAAGIPTIAADRAAILAPTGTLRVALYPGTPTSILQPDGQAAEARGVGYDFGKTVAAEIGVPFAPMVLSKNADVLEAIKTGEADMAFTNATASRAKDMDFGPPYLEIELGYLVPPDGTVGSIADVDHTGRRIGVTAGSTSDSVLSRDLKAVTIVRAPTIREGLAMLRSGEIDAFATNKATLFEMAEKMPGSRVLDGRWGVERHAIAIPKGREAAIPVVSEITREAIASGTIAKAIERAGLRGAVVAAPR